MDELRDLQEMAQNAVARFNEYQGKDFILPKAFKERVTSINSCSIRYNKYSAIIDTAGYQNGNLNIYMPNQWFYIASYFTDYYNELLKYKKIALNITTKERLKNIGPDGLLENELKAIENLEFSQISKDYLKRFITDYSWWGGAKTIDRGDFYVSPILSHAKLVNASQSYVADLCAFLADKQELVQIIINGVGEDDMSPSQGNLSLQTIFYGSPGTGKSFKVKKYLEDKNIPQDFIFRTTFHPDSDYASFVGSYKPVQRNGSTIFGPQGLTEEELINTFLNSNKASQKKARFLYESLVNMGDVKKLGLSHGDIDKALKSRGFTECTYNGEFSAMQTIHDWLLEDERFNKNEIIYEFVPQAFTEAYVKAKKCTEQVYLVIEEINRGNCAQIFGDLFQLLDRKNGVSEYPIKGEADLIKYLNEECGIEGDTLSLPANLNIIATMNTSDQSLFPMDSAFKRRWDWKYIPTMPPANEDKLLEFHQEGNKDKGLNVGDFVYSWKKFLEAANARIYAATRSEDKQLGYWFVKTGDDNKISISDFVSKVVFYLWNDVFKDLGPKDCNPFTIEMDGKKSLMSFNSFFELDSENNITENIGVLHTFLKNFNLTPDVAKEIQEAQDASNLEGPQA